MNTKCGLELSHEFSLYQPSLISEPDRHNVLEGRAGEGRPDEGSHSAKMTDALDDTCLEVVDISVRGWRITNEAVEDKVKQLSEIVSQ